MFRSISIRARLTGLVLIPLIVLIVLIVNLFSHMNTLQTGISSLYDDRIVPLKQIKATSDMYGISTVDLFHKYRGDQISAQQLTSAILSARDTAGKEWQAYKSTFLTPEEDALVKEADRQFADAARLTDRYLELVRSGEFRALDNTTFIHDLYARFDPLTKALEDLISLQLRVSAEFVQASQASYDHLMTVLILLCSAVVAGLALLGYLMYRSINDPVQGLCADIQFIADQSDLTRRVAADGRDEITHLSQTLNGMFGRFHSVISHLRDAVHQSSTAAEEMSAISRQVSTTVQQQDEQVAMVATAITEMSGAVKEVANNASETSAQATRADGQAREGLLKVQENLSAINRLSDAVTHASGVIDRLHDQSGEITTVLTVIRSIAEQTNLLALNAAIESARAGEAGRGFAVVADEVRKLAQNTQQATESISQMIDQLQASARQAVDTMGQAGQQASGSLTHAEAAGELLEAIASSVSRIAEMNFQVSTATEEQAQVANEIHDSVTRFSMGLSDVSESASQSAVASEEIARLSNDLQQQVSTFRI
ncbi:methyl-accepting chemotaxis protein [Thalassolituus sp. LLYu03]|uniref:methyl-accepting chemotaxis protein n=1 Tax=Thalassolituus sp. LLYu03 TaxID=3421656 RepID=UPI003D2E3327